MLVQDTTAHGQKVIKVVSFYVLWDVCCYDGSVCLAGMASLAAGLAIGIVGDSCVRAYGKQDKIFVAMILMLIFAEALGLYGLIISLLMNNAAQRANNDATCDILY